MYEVYVPTMLHTGLTPLYTVLNNSVKEKDTEIEGVGLKNKL